MIELSGEINTFLLGMTPVGGLRVSIPVALTVYELSPLSAYLISVMGNLFSVFLVLVFLDIASKWLSQHSYFFNRFFAALFEKTRKKHSARVEKYGLYALIAFAALPIPLPMTGGWMSSLIAFVFDIPIKRAFPVIAIGTLIDGLTILFISTAGIAINKYFGWQVLIGTAFVLGISYFLYKKVINSRNNRHF